MEKVIEGAYEVLGIFDRIEESRESMLALTLTQEHQHSLAHAALTYRYGEGHHPVTKNQILMPRRWEDKKDDLWTTFQQVQENLSKGGLLGRSATGKRAQTSAINGIDGDIKLNRALWVMAEQLRQAVD